ncbi:unnamed protein product [Amoebophrya sp. A120]|nr:unnamed protein product [Amoebophrya sp. A120]|eukprot:GSA120T00015279001.1
MLPPDQMRGYNVKATSSSEPVVRSLLERLCAKLAGRSTPGHLKLIYRLLSLKSLTGRGTERELCDAISELLLQADSSGTVRFQALRRRGLLGSTGKQNLLLAEVLLLLARQKLEPPDPGSPKPLAQDVASGGVVRAAAFPEPISLVASAATSNRTSATLRGVLPQGGGPLGYELGPYSSAFVGTPLVPNPVLRDMVYCGPSEAEIIRDCLYALQGIESATVVWDGGAPAAFRLKETVSIAKGAQGLVAELLAVGTDYRRVDQVLELPNESVIFQAFRQCVRNLLLDYFKWIAIFETQIDSGDLSLRRLAIWFRQPRKKMALLSRLCRVAAAHGKGGPLLSALHMCRKTGDPHTAPIVEAVLQASAAPLHEMIRAWMTEGQLRDQLGEFFVFADATAKIQDLWHSMYFLNLEMIPSFVDLEEAKMILRAGKSVNFMRLCCEESDWVGLLAGAPVVTDSDFVRQQSLHTNKRLVELLLDKYNLLSHCVAMKRYLLLAQGDFIECLLELADGVLRKDAKKDVFRHNVRAIVDQAIRQSNAQFHDPEFLDRLDVSLTPANGGEIGWDIFSLDYAITSPLHVVFSRDTVMLTLRKVSTFLWKLRRANFSLKESWRRQILIRHKCDEDALARQMDSIRMVLSHVMENVQSYVMYEVLETAHARLEQGFQNARDLDEVLREHGKYLHHLQEFTFLVDSAAPILDCLTKFLLLVSTFERLQEDVARYFFDESAEEMLWRDMEALDEEVSETMQHLLDLLQQPKNSCAEYTYLVCRLNFNNQFR